MTHALNKPTVDETRYLKFLNNTGAAIGANLVLVPDASAAGAAKLPATGSVIKEIVGVTPRAVASAAVDGEAIGIGGDTAVCIANGAISKGDRVYVTTNSGHEGQVSKFTGFKTNGAQFVLGIAQDDASDTDTVAVRLAPHRVGDGFQAGTATLAAGVATVTGVTISSTTGQILHSRNTAGGTIGSTDTRATNRVASTVPGGGSFTITATVTTDTSTIDWLIVDDAG